MNIERAILIAFIGNYLINNIVAGLVTLIPGSPTAKYSDPHYIGYVILAAIFVAVFTYWYAQKAKVSTMGGAIFGVIGVLTAIATAFVSGVSGVLAQSGSFSQVMNILPQFLNYVENWSTLALVGFWIIPAALVGMYLAKKSPAATTSASTTPSFGSHTTPTPARTM